MAVAIARSAVLGLSGSTAGRVVLGAFPGGLWLPRLTFVLNADAAGAVTLSPVLVRGSDAGLAAHLNGRAVLDVGESALNGKPAVVVDLASDTVAEFSLPVGLLTGSGPYWILLMGQHANGLATSRIIMSGIAVPFEGATRQRRSGDGAAPLSIQGGGVGGGSAVGGGGRSGGG